MSYTNPESVPQTIPQSKQQQETSRKMSLISSGSPTEELLGQSSNYTEGCELYPKAMRDTVNQCTDGAVCGARDPRIVKDAERRYEESLRKQRRLSALNPDEERQFYPGAMRTGAYN